MPRHLSPQAVSPGEGKEAEAGEDCEHGVSTMVLDAAMRLVIDLDPNDEGEGMDEQDEDEPEGTGEDGQGLEQGIPDIPDGLGNPVEGVPEVPAGYRRPRRYAVRDRRRRLVTPREPTQAERDEHMLTHQPPEHWCEYCEKGKSPGEVSQEDSRG